MNQYAFVHDGTDKLVRMANQIADFFDSQPEAARVSGVAEHIRHYWVKKMRHEMYAHLDDHLPGLHPTALAALQQLRSAEKSR